MIFNPYDWSTVVNWTVNISLISALLIIRFTEKFSWEDWHEWMKRNAEVATNIETWYSVRESEEGNRDCFMRRFPVIKILMTVVLGLWPAGNI